jgi:hypothetical protein
MKNPNAQWKVTHGYKLACCNTDAKNYKWAAFQDGWAGCTARGFRTKAEAQRCCDEQEQIFWQGVEREMSGIMPAEIETTL